VTVISDLDEIVSDLDDIVTVISDLGVEETPYKLLQ
jgi:hypothetical protein